MASILEGQQYALTSQFASKAKGQSMVFVKLTDSALKAIEDYAAALSKGNVSPSFKPSIEFRPNNSQGVISIPTKVNGTNNGELTEKQSYNFSLKDVQSDGGVQEAVQQNRRDMSMDSLGKILLRMQIHANDDSYQNTRVKMAQQAEQELKKYNTKVIQQGDPNVGRKVKVKRPIGGGSFAGGGNSCGKSLSKPTSQNHPNHHLTGNGGGSSSASANAAASSSTLASTSSTSSSSMYKKSPSMPSTALLTSMPRFGSKFTTNSSAPASSASSSNNLLQKSQSQLSTSPPLPEATKRALRETIVHLLALRPMKLGELMGKAKEQVPGFSFSSSSSSASTKEQLMGVLNAVASTKKEGGGGGSPLYYHLKEGGWEELQMDWPHYSKEDRELVMRRNPLMANNNHSNSSNNTVSPNGPNNHPNNHNNYHNSHNPPTNLHSLQHSQSYHSNANHHHQNHLKSSSSAAINGNGNGLNSSGISPLSDGSSIRSMVSAHSSPSPPPPPTVSDTVGGGGGHQTTSPPISGHHQLQNHHHQNKANLASPQSNSSSNSSSSGSDRPRHSGSIGNHHQHQQSLKRAGGGGGGNNGYSSSSSGPLKKFKAAHNQSSNSSSNAVNNGGGDGKSTNGNGGSNSSNSQPAYSKYTRIQSAEQLAAYRADFYAEYPEYRRQFEYVDGVSREFERLRELVFSKDEDSEEWQDAVRQTILKYEEVKNGDRFPRAQKRLQYLHYKLLHIKNLITEYLQRVGGSGANGGAGGHGGNETMPRLMMGGSCGGDDRHITF